MDPSLPPMVACLVLRSGFELYTTLLISDSYSLHNSEVPLTERVFTVTVADRIFGALLSDVTRRCDVHSYFHCDVMHACSLL